MAAMKPRTGDGPMEAVREGRLIIVKVPLEGGGRLVVSVNDQEARPKYGWTDVSRFSQLGIPAVNFGPGDGALAHAPNEQVPISQLESTHKTLRDWLSQG